MARPPSLLQAPGQGVKRWHGRQKLAPAAVIAALQNLKAGVVKGFNCACIEAQVGVAAAAQPPIPLGQGIGPAVLEIDEDSPRTQHGDNPVEPPGILFKV